MSIQLLNSVLWQLGTSDSASVCRVRGTESDIVMVWQMGRKNLYVRKVNRRGPQRAVLVDAAVWEGGSLLGKWRDPISDDSLNFQVLSLSLKKLNASSEVWVTKTDKDRHKSRLLLCQSVSLKLNYQQNCLYHHCLLMGIKIDIFFPVWFSGQWLSCVV